jgi:NitT/TauT family transport system ATP-binding protein
VVSKPNKQKHPENTAALEIRKLNKFFYSDHGSAVQALQDIDLTVNSGEFLILLGATGCGKTSLLNLIAGLDKPDEGLLNLDNTLKFGENIAYVFQHYTLFPWRTTLGNVTFSMEMRGLSRNQRKPEAAKLLSKVGLKGFETSYPHELSGGMRQRAAIAQALAMKPKLILMDEPFGAVDDNTRAELQQMITQLWQENQSTIIFVTHNIDEALILGDRVIVLSERPGRIVREYKIDLTRPRDRMTKEFTNLFIQIRQSLSGQLD